MPQATLDGPASAVNLTKEDIIPFKYRVVGPARICWVFDLQRAALPILPVARNNDGELISNRYDIIDVIKYLIKNRSQQRTNSTIGQLEAARMRKLTVDTEREVIKNEMLKAKLVRIEDADAEVADMIMAVRGKLMGYPSHVGRLVLGKEDYDEVVRILTDVLEQTLKELRTMDYASVVARNRKLITAIGMDAFDTESKDLDDNFGESGDGDKRPVGRPRKDSE